MGLFADIKRLLWKTRKPFGIKWYFDAVDLRTQKDGFVQVLPPERKTMSERTYTEDQIRRGVQRRYCNLDAESCVHIGDDFMRSINQVWEEDQKNEVQWGDTVEVHLPTGVLLGGVAIGYDEQRDLVYVRYPFMHSNRVESFRANKLRLNGCRVTGWKS